MSSKISAISEIDVGRITSGQVIVDLTSAVKELLDNSIDAGADQFECVFKNYGLESIECSDNGSGVPEDSYEGLALKHHTSKISSFEDVSQVTTLGFRGEALSSLAAIANLVVTTTTTPPKAARLEFNAKGELTKQTVTSRNKGTTVLISQLFNNLPVRKKDFTRNCKRQFNKCIALLQQYTIIQDRMKISIWHITSNGRRTLVLSSTKDQGIPKRIVGVYGSSAMQGLSGINLHLVVNSGKSWASQAFGDDYKGASEYTIDVSGFISKSSSGCGRNAKDRQFVYINQRPVIYPSLIKCCNEVYRTNNNVQFPACFLNFQVAPEFIDVNITPDKRTVILHSESAVIDTLRDALARYFSDQEMVLPISSKVKMENVDEPEPKKHKTAVVSQELDFEFHNDMGTSEPQPDNSELVERGKPASQNFQPENDLEVQEPKIFVLDSELSGEEDEADTRPAPNVKESIVFGGGRTSVSIPKIKKTQGTLDVFANHTKEADSEFLVRKPNAAEEPLTMQIGDEHFEERATITRDNQLIFSKNADSNHSDHSHGSCTCSSANEEDSDDELFEENSFSVDGNDEITQYSADPSHIPVFRNSVISEPTEQRPAHTPKSSTLSQRGKTLKSSAHAVNSDILCVTVQVSPVKLDNKFTEQARLIERQRTRKHENFIQKNEQIENFEEGEKYLTLSVSKGDFKTMQIVGQFNLGFILATRRIGRKFDLFIIDQHAGDEKFNFEMLQRNTVLKSQRLIAPQVVEMSVMDELIAMENLNVFEKNGFKLEVEKDQPQGGRVRLVSLPVSKKTVFDMNDLHELIHFVRESDGLNKDAVRCSKVRAMLAMRACRSSIMVGKALSKKMMVRVVRNLSELDKPWNCPHGRPTMRHLMELRDWNVFDDDYAL
ncbi:LAME_0D06524g1_1 [Lachancea meyersii CBS 8951]|uniref:DNA mismatch repair protein PMS1 n=1 Tax=Lachancea meyersii CBS 8951 TaxID=1266667 RepID=A0A1G4J9D0_9SACH|nr:LAME_0D06524g1_1 [Lachancea meyersii CBS 8951]